MRHPLVQGQATFDAPCPRMHSQFCCYNGRSIQPVAKRCLWVLNKKCSLRYRSPYELRMTSCLAPSSFRVYVYSDRCEFNKASAW
ncbi:hypothetical protein KEM48_004198 [Puccinia striiformis f. sp. tritici PST-130]|nr:hypothetical protein KEM48_004198 [Puccinia striiformis f. sp. tritici PST-130]